jgi:Mg2+/Co2+ transporter CorC
MEKEDIIELIRSEVAKEFGEERIKDIEYFGPYEGEDLNVRVRTGGLEDRNEGYGVHGRSV